MSRLNVRGRGQFIRTHRDKVIHLTQATARSGFPAMTPPNYLRRPLKFLALFLLATGLSVLVCFALVVLTPVATPRIGIQALCIGGIVLLVLARRWADAYYDHRPRRPRPRLVR